MNKGIRLIAAVVFLLAHSASIQALDSDTTAMSFEVASELYQQRNYRDAYHAFLKLAEDGDPRAQTVTALMLKFGEGVEQNSSAAFAWYLSAAQQAYPAAQYHTGAMLADGVGVAADEQEAIKWLTLAADNGFERAIGKLAELNASANVLGVDSEELSGWSKNWDLKLPMDLQLKQFDEEPIKPNQLYLVQVGAMSTRASANRLWEVLINQHQKLFLNKVPIIETTAGADRRIYRIQTGPFPNFQAADDFCGRLMTSTIQAGCLPIKRE